VLHIDRADNRAVITFAWGTCTLEATDTALLVRVETNDNESLGQAEALLAQRIQTIGHRDQLAVGWKRNQPPEQPVERDQTARVRQPVARLRLYVPNVEAVERRQAEQSVGLR
jgi:hypothetical protein